jgi:hypothetical protein
MARLVRELLYPVHTLVTGYRNPEVRVYCETSTLSSYLNLNVIITYVIVECENCAKSCFATIGWLQFSLTDCKLRTASRNELGV